MRNQAHVIPLPGLLEVLLRVQAVTSWGPVRCHHWMCLALCDVQPLQRRASQGMADGCLRFKHASATWQTAGAATRKCRRLQGTLCAEEGRRGLHA